MSNRVLNNIKFYKFTFINSPQLNIHTQGLIDGRYFLEAETYSAN